MTTRTVTDPHGVTWRVRRRWIPHREGRGVSARLKRRRREETGSTPRGTTDNPAATRKRRFDWVDLVDVPDVDSIAALVVVIVAVVALAVLVAFGPGLVLLGIDLAWLVIVFVAGLVARVVLRRPWMIEAVSANERRQWGVQGLRAAGRTRDEIAGDLEAGLRPLGDST